MKYTVDAGGVRYDITVEDREGPPAVTVNGRPVAVDFAALHDGRHFSLITDQKSWDVALAREPDLYRITLVGRTFACSVIDDTIAGIKGTGTVGAVKKRRLRTPMPGLVTAVEAKAGDQVKAGDGLVTVEAMKMQNELRAESDATVKEVRVRPGQVVDKNDVLIVFK
ncbi:MAG: biotin/lipoyl-binding protein [Deltaproteobacteria bacterium]|nr:biotin/lipoyl-binding protein [Deltaproteobacteria bacterium]